MKSLIYINSFENGKNPDVYFIEKEVDPDQLAPSETS